MVVLFGKEHQSRLEMAFALFFRFMVGDNGSDGFSYNR